MFDLNQAVKNWRTSLGVHPNFRTTDLDELEDHLREEISELMTHGLTEEEAFWVSSRRLGQPEELNSEFAIADPKRRRSTRLSWMIIGALALVFLWLGAGVLTNFGTGVLSWMPGQMVGVGWAAGLIRLLALLLGGALVWRLLATDRSSLRLKKMGGGTVILGAMLLAFLTLASRLGADMFLLGVMPQEEFMSVMTMNAWFSLVTVLVLPVLLLFGLWRLIRT